MGQAKKFDEILKNRFALNEDELSAEKSAALLLERASGSVTFLQKVSASPRSRGPIEIFVICAIIISLNDVIMTSTIL